MDDPAREGEERPGSPGPISPSLPSRSFKICENVTTARPGCQLEPSLYVFTTNGERPVFGFSKAKRRLDGHMKRLLSAQIEESRDPARAEIEGWILHDLRHTAATGMAGLNIAPHVVDRILNHVSGTISRVLKKSLLICRSVVPWNGGWGWRCAATMRFVESFSAT